MHMYFASAVLTTLFQCKLAVSMLAVYTNNSQSHWIRFLTAVMQMWLGSAFWGLWSIHWVCVREFFACLEYCLDFVVINDKHCICALLTSFVVPLRHASKVFSKCSLPNICCGWIMHQFFVTGYGLASDGMYHVISVMFKVGGQLFYCVLHEDVGCAHCIH